MRDYKKKMSLSNITLVTISAFIYWYLNRHKPIKHILRELRNTLNMQAVGIFGLIDDYMNMSRNKTVLPDAIGRTAVITGGERGIGSQVVRSLLKANMTVVMGTRKPESAKKLANQWEHGENLHVYHLDLLSLKSIKEFADTVSKEFPDIHILVNNAGVMFEDFKLTEDGFESLLAVNHLGHFYLTHLLLPSLKRGGKVGKCSRVVNLSSCAHYPGRICFDDINSKEYYDTSEAYSQAKLAQLMSARYINKILEEQCSTVKCYAVHPGVVNTDLVNRSLWKKMFPWAVKLVFKTPEKGAVPILHACFSEDLENNGGMYISNCIEGISSPVSKKLEIQKKLFEVSCELVKIDRDRFGEVEKSCSREEA